jgi:hypothetical protein
MGSIRPTEGVPVFPEGHAPTAAELQTYLAATSPDLALGPLQSAACTYRIAFGPRAGQKVRSLPTVPTQAPPPAPVPCVSAQGFERACRGALRRPSEEETRTVMPLPHPPCHRQR